VAECDDSKAGSDSEQVSGMSFNINNIIGQISNFVDNIRGFSSNGEPMSIKVEGFNIAVSKDQGQYEFALSLRLVIKPK
jgi:hypothetical protein